MGKVKPQSTPQNDTAYKQTAVKDQPGRSKRPRHIVRDAPPWVSLAWEAVEAAGFRIAGDSVDFGRYVLIECLLPSELRGTLSADNPNYETIMRYQISLVRQALQSVGIEAEVQPTGWRLVIWLPTEKRHNRVGRPRMDEVRDRVRALRDAKKSWAQLTLTINRETGRSLSANAYRNLLGRAK
jgi:hypothetical protein